MNSSIEPPSLRASLIGLPSHISDASYLYLLIIILLLLLSAFASGSESAYFSLKPKDNAAIKENPSARAKLILKLLAKPQELLATILIFNNFVNVGIVILSSFVLNDIFPPQDGFSPLRFVSHQNTKFPPFMPKIDRIYFNITYMFTTNFQKYCPKK